MRKPCEQCPWRVANHGRRHRGFYTKANLRRLWFGIRSSNVLNSCHPTDTSHPAHGAKPGSRAQECTGGMILVWRELRRVRRCGPEPGSLTPAGFDAYMKQVRRGLTRLGFLGWAIRSTCDLRAMRGPGPLPPASEELLDDPAYGLPAGVGPEDRDSGAPLDP